MAEIRSYFVIRAKRGPFGEWRYLESAPKFDDAGVIIKRVWLWDGGPYAGFPFFCETHAKWFMEATKSLDAKMTFDDAEIVERSYDDLVASLSGLSLRTGG
jgi:hypothetical protein